MWQHLATITVMFAMILVPNSIFRTKHVNLMDCHCYAMLRDHWVWEYVSKLQFLDCRLHSLRDECQDSLPACGHCAPQDCQLDTYDMQMQRQLQKGEDLSDLHRRQDHILKEAICMKSFSRWVRSLSKLCFLTFYRGLVTEVCSMGSVVWCWTTTSSTSRLDRERWYAIIGFGESSTVWFKHGSYLISFHSFFSCIFKEHLKSILDTFLWNFASRFLNRLALDFAELQRRGSAQSFEWDDAGQRGSFLATLVQEPYTNRLTGLPQPQSNYCILLPKNCQHLIVLTSVDLLCLVRCFPKECTPWSVVLAHNEFILLFRSLRSSLFWVEVSSKWMTGQGVTGTNLRKRCCVQGAGLYTSKIYN